MFSRSMKSRKYSKLIIKSQSLVGNVELYMIMPGNDKSRDKEKFDVYFNLKDDYFSAKAHLNKHKIFMT